MDKKKNPPPWGQSWIRHWVQVRITYGNDFSGVSEHVDVSNDRSGRRAAPPHRRRHGAAAARSVRRMICRLNVDEELYHAGVRV